MNAARVGARAVVEGLKDGRVVRASFNGMQAVDEQMQVNVTSKVLVVLGVAVLTTACDSRRSADVDSVVDRSRTLNVGVAGEVADAGVPAADAVEGGYLHDDGDGEGLKATAPQGLQRFVGSGDFELLPKPDASLAPSEHLLTSTDRVLESASKLPPDDEVGVSFSLDEVAANWAEFRNAPDDAARVAFIDAPKAALAARQQSLLTWLASVGATNIEPRWATNSVFARLKAKHVPSAIAHPDVRSASGSHAKMTAATPWNGTESKHAMMFEKLRLNGATGWSGG